MEEAKRTLVFTELLESMDGTIKEAEGLVLGYTLVLPDFTTAASAILTIKDKDGYTVYTGDSKNKNTTSVVVNMAGLCPMKYGYTFTLTLNAASGGAHSAVVKLYIAKR